MPEGCLRLMTVRSHDQYNTTVYGLNDRYRGVHGRRDVVFLNAEDAAERGLSHGDRVDLTRAANRDGESRRNARQGKRGGLQPRRRPPSVACGDRPRV